MHAGRGQERRLDVCFFISLHTIWLASKLLGHVPSHLPDPNRRY